MDHLAVGELWNANAEAWTTLSRGGYDIYRDQLNTPAFFEMLPPVAGLAGVDLGCGEGYNTRLLARRGARVTGVDISSRFVGYARETEAAEPLGIEYRQASAVELPFADGAFDFATGFMSFMDIPETGRLLAETFRVLKAGGFLQFSILHPCFMPPHRRNLRDAQRRTYAIEVGDYFRPLRGEVEEWIFTAAPEEAKRAFPKFRVPRFNRTLSDWLNLIVGAGFTIEHTAEPAPSDEDVRRCPDLQDAQVVAYFLILRARKPAERAR